MVRWAQFLLGVNCAILVMWRSSFLPNLKTLQWQQSAGCRASYEFSASPPEAFSTTSPSWKFISRKCKTLNSNTDFNSGVGAVQSKLLYLSSFYNSHLNAIESWTADTSPLKRDGNFCHYFPWDQNFYIHILLRTLFPEQHTAEVSKQHAVQAVRSPLPF